MRISQISNQRNISGTHSQELRRAFLLAQVVFAVVLLAGAGLLIRSFVAIQSVDPGFRTSRVLAATLRFSSALPVGRRAALYGHAITHIEDLQEVKAVGAISTMFSLTGTRMCH
jgi:hypothetical protein